MGMKVMHYFLAVGAASGALVRSKDGPCGHCPDGYYCLLSKMSQLNTEIETLDKRYELTNDDDLLRKKDKLNKQGEALHKKAQALWKKLKAQGKENEGCPKID